jgi:hypothetical protein
MKPFVDLAPAPTPRISSSINLITAIIVAHLSLTPDSRYQSAAGSLGSRKNGPPKKLTFP